MFDNVLFSISRYHYKYVLVHSELQQSFIVNFYLAFYYSYVFSAPEQLLESMPGTLMLTDCLEACQANESCGAVNYETGLCVLFSANADKLPGMLNIYHFQLYTIKNKGITIEIHSKQKHIPSVLKNCTFGKKDLVFWRHVCFKQNWTGQRWNRQMRSKNAHVRAEFDN